ncbi:MAG: tRNA-(ms[2]io[6]A)-hydroxylase, partial [Porticoccus sp.]|nr:tRNA-(ms[2]io[6]A)-hydroxylase [Porticoccus sp.]
LARKAAGTTSIDERISVIREKEQELIETPDSEFHFHSGPPC